MKKQELLQGLNLVGILVEYSFQILSRLKIIEALIMNRVKWERTALENARINSSDSEFMAKYGMPNLKSDELEFSTNYLLKALNGTDCHRIGTYGILNDVHLFVRESVAGVWIVDEDTTQLILVNSSTSALSNFIGLREKYLLDIEMYLPAKLREEFVTIVKKTMEEIDPTVMTTNGIWGPFMQDMCNQLVYYEDEFK